MRPTQALRHRVLHDSLTGLPNRPSFVGSLSEALKRGTVSGSPVGILFLDLDHFKLINDSLGHHAGDELLRAVAPRLRAHLRPGDIVARFGGDEFGVLVDRLADEDEAVAIADRVSAAFAEPFPIGGVDHFITASLGIAVARPSTREPADPDMLIRDADAAMYRAKERGRSRCELFDAEMRARALRRLEVERELRQGIERDELSLNYQPVLCLASGEVTGLEALVRWEHPERGQLDPSEFIPVAEESGLIEPLGRWVQENACRQILEWHEQRPDERPLDISVNLSARQVAHRDLAASVAEVLTRTGLDPVHLCLEITESVLVEESASAKATLEALSELGVRLVLDDFGTGYSSLAYLNRFPLDALKIDRSFIDALGVEQERDRDRRGDHRHGASPLARRDRRGRRKRGPALRAAAPRLRLRPGPPLLAGAAPREDHPACWPRGCPAIRRSCPAGRSRPALRSPAAVGRSGRCRASSR